MTDVIILAGGMGTRLKSIIKDIPKPMADVNGRPFLAFQLDYLAKEGVKHIILSVGYRYEVIVNYFGNSFAGMKLDYIIDPEPLGTGGAVIRSLKSVTTENVFIINGDTFFPAPLEELMQFHNENNSSFSIALRAVKNSSRFGLVQLCKNGVISGFSEKTNGSSGLINAGLYIANVSFLNQFMFPEKFSLEKDFMECYYQTYPFWGKSFDVFFIDIGIPEDYLLFQNVSTHVI